MLKKIGIGLAVIFLIIAVLAMRQPDTFEITRSANIAAPAQVVYGYTNDFHEWQKWSPWEKLDPNMQRTFSGHASGVGAGYAWSGNSEAGAGTMTIKESVPGEKVGINLDFIKPFESKTITEFTMKPVGDSTDVVWTMSGPNQFISKVMGVFVSVDKMVGPDFEKGLASLKALAEADAKRMAAAAAAVPAVDSTNK